MTRAERLVVAIAILVAVLAGGLGAGAALENHLNYQAQQRQAQVRGEQIERKLCESFSRLAAIVPPAGNPVTNPSRRFDQQSHAVLIGIGADIGCRRV